MSEFASMGDWSDGDLSLHGEVRSKTTFGVKQDEFSLDMLIKEKLVKSQK